MTESTGLAIARIESLLEKIDSKNERGKGRVEGLNQALEAMEKSVGGRLSKVFDYTELDRDECLVQGVEVCRIAAESGQIVLAQKHLSALTAQMEKLNG